MSIGRGVFTPLKPPIAGGYDFPIGATGECAGIDLSQMLAYRKKSLVFKQLLRVAG